RQLFALLPVAGDCRVVSDGWLWSIPVFLHNLPDRFAGSFLESEVSLRILSNAPRCAALAAADFVSTLIPAKTLVAQALTRLPLTSTMQVSHVLMALVESDNKPAELLLLVRLMRSMRRSLSSASTDRP